jgi:uncharacterized protein (DUF1919 family)
MIRKLLVFVKRKFRSVFKDAISKKDIALLKDKNFVIVSDDCWGGSLYQWYKRSYNSPFVGLAIYGDCYLKLLSNFDYYMQQNLKFIQESKYQVKKLNYPLGLLDDIEIHFLHYIDEEEARIKWERRTGRMLTETNKDSYFFKLGTYWSANEEHIQKFHHLDFKNKMSFSLNKGNSLKTNHHIQVIERSKKYRNKIPNGKKLFKLTFLYYDLNKWLLS